MPDPLKLLNPPPVTVTLAAVKLVDGSLRAKEMVAVSPILSVGLFVVMNSVGASVSIDSGVAS